MIRNRNAKTIKQAAALITAVTLLCCSCSKETGSGNDLQPTPVTPVEQSTDIVAVPTAEPTSVPTAEPTLEPAADDTSDTSVTDIPAINDETNPDSKYVFTPVSGDFSGLTDSISDFRVMSADGPVSLIYLMTWTDNSGDSPKDYEFCLTGLMSNPSDQKLVEMINAFTLGEKYVYTEDAELIDTEKQFGIPFPELGYPVTNHDLFSRANFYERLGDSDLCWAASSSNMLINSGWAYKAINPSTGDYFKTTDEVFEYFVESFSNGGNTQKNGSDWFIGGRFIRENASDADCLLDTGALLPEYDSDDNVIWDTIEEEDDIALITALLSGCNKLKEGYSLGTNIWLYSKGLYLDGQDEPSLNYDLIRDDYYLVDWAGEVEIDSESIEDYYTTYIYDENNHRVPVLLSDGKYTDADGNVYDDCDVYENYLLYDEKQGNYNPIILGNIGYTCESREYVDSSRVTYEGDYNYSGGHAMTCMGYIINKNADNDFDKIEALIIGNSDDDDNEIHPFRSENAREFRPDKYTLYCTHVSDSCADSEGSRLICLEDFKANNEVYIYQIFSMKPFED